MKIPLINRDSLVFVPNYLEWSSNDEMKSCAAPVISVVDAQWANVIIF